MNTPPRTTKEALFAEMLGDMDRMLARIERLPELVDGCEQRLRDIATILESAGKQYGQAVATFTEQARVELRDFIERESAAAIERQSKPIKQFVPDVQISESILLKKLLLYLLTHGSAALLASWITIFFVNYV